MGAGQVADVDEGAKVEAEATVKAAEAGVDADAAEAGGWDMAAAPIGGVGEAAEATTAAATAAAMARRTRRRRRREAERLMGGCGVEERGGAWGVERTRRATAEAVEAREVEPAKTRRAKVRARVAEGIKVHVRER